MFKRILVAVDGSEASDKALRRAIQGAKTLGCGLHFISISERPQILGGYKGEVGFRSGLEWVVDRGRKIAEEAGVQVESVEIRSGNPAEEIVSYAEEVGFDYIVLGRKGSRLSMRFRLGSTTHKVVTYAPCVVVVVPRREETDSNFGRVMVAIDGSEHSNKAFERATQLARDWQRGLHIVAVAQKMPAYVDDGVQVELAMEHQRNSLRDLLERSAGEAQDSGVEVEAIDILEGTPSEAILEHVEKIRYDFIILGRRGEGIRRRFRLGSTTHKLISYAPCTVVVVPRRDPYRLEDNEEVAG